MSRKRAFLSAAGLLAMLIASPVTSGVRVGDQQIAAPRAPTIIQMDGPIVLAQIAPGMSEAEAVAEGYGETAAPPGPLQRVWAFLLESYHREPALMIALGLVFVLSPIVSILLLIMQSTQRVIAKRATTRGQSLKEAMQAAGGATATTEPGVAAYWQAEATLEFVDEAFDPLPLIGPMSRIGRHEENDVRLADKTVHRHHAVLQLTGEQDYTITDLSGAEGNGVLVNSERVTQARLRPGDIIELGAVKLRFALHSGRTSGRAAGQTQVTLH